MNRKTVGNLIFIVEKVITEMFKNNLMQNLLQSSKKPYMSKLKVKFNYSTIASTVQLFNYSTIYVKVGGDLER